MPEQSKAPVFERSVATLTEMEFRAAEGGDGTRFTGYAAVFNAESEPLPFIETIAPGAFTRSLKAGGQTFVVDHDDTKLLSSVRAKTLRLTEDSKGLIVDADLPKTSYAEDLRELHARGEIRSMSFTFRPTRGGETLSDGGRRRMLSDVKLGHVTVLTGLTPAYRQTTASIRALAHQIESEAEDLSDAIDALRNGDALDAAQCALLERVVVSLAPEESRWSSAASDASSATYALSSLLSLLGNETGDPDQADLLKAAIAALQAFISAETEEIGTDADIAASRANEVPESVRSALADNDARLAVLQAR